MNEETKTEFHLPTAIANTVMRCSCKTHPVVEILLSAASEKNDLIERSRAQQDHYRQAAEKARDRAEEAAGTRELVVRELERFEREKAASATFTVFDPTKGIEGTHRRFRVTDVRRFVMSGYAEGYEEVTDA